MSYIFCLSLGTLIGFFIASLCRVGGDGPVMPTVRNWDEATYTPDVPDQASQLRRQMQGQKGRWQ